MGTYEEVSQPVLEIPLHVAIIPDGNRRWARLHNLSSLKGHLKGYEKMEELVSEARKAGVKFLTVWAFSTENWARSKEEVNDLLKLIHKALEKIQTKSHTEKTRFVHLGRKDRLGSDIVSLISTLEEETKEYRDFCLSLAIDYGGEDELQRAEIKLQSNVDPHLSLKDFLDTSLNKIPAPDLIIRTSGECRTSGFMPLQSAYSEWIFEEAQFPDFSKELFHKALLTYSTRIRRFGK